MSCKIQKDLTEIWSNATEQFSAAIKEMTAAKINTISKADYTVLRARAEANRDRLTACILPSSPYPRYPWEPEAVGMCGRRRQRITRNESGLPMYSTSNNIAPSLVEGGRSLLKLATFAKACTGYDGYRSKRNTFAS
jgi:hypothetical protein